MNYNQKLFENLKSADEEIEKANAIKTKTIDKFLTEIKDVTNIFYDLWEEKESQIKKEIQNLGKKYNFTFPYGYNEELSIDKIIRNLVSQFPIENYGGEVIYDSLPRTNAQWEFTDNSNQEKINIEVNPIDIYSRYPTDPENNEQIFEYKMDLQIHNQLMNMNYEEKQKLIESYFETKIQQYMQQLEMTISKKSAIVAKTIENIDFNNPEIVAELRKKLKT